MRSVFVSYRRGDSEGQARALNSELVNRLGKDAVFMDVDSIALGRDFRHILRERLDSCDLMLALIGPGWLDAKDGAGNRRLESATDLVRLEVAAALARNIPVIPVLLQGALIPPPERLPEDIRELAYRNGFELGHSTWESDVRELLRRLGLDSVVPGAAPVAAAEDRKDAPPAADRFRLAWLAAVLALVGLVVLVLVYRSSPAPESIAQAEPTSLSSSQPSAQPAAEPSRQQSAAGSGQVSAGFGTITIGNLKERIVEVYTQAAEGTNFLDPGSFRLRPQASRSLRAPIS